MRCSAGSARGRRSSLADANRHRMPRSCPRELTVFKTSHSHARRARCETLLMSHPRRAKRHARPVIEQALVLSQIVVGRSNRGGITTPGVGYCEGARSVEWKALAVPFRYPNVGV